VSGLPARAVGADYSGQQVEARLVHKNKGAALACRLLVVAQIAHEDLNQMAVACAAGFAAGQLVFHTDVDGVLDGAKQLCPELTIADCERLIAEGAATGGMQAKLNAAISALKQGVEQVRIAPGGAPDALSRILAGEQLGTQLVN